MRCARRIWTARLPAIFAPALAISLVIGPPPARADDKANSTEKAAPSEKSAPVVRLASGVSGHIHPACCVSKKGTVVVIFGQSDYKDLKLCRSTDGGKTWSEPALFGPTEKLSIYPGSLTTLKDGRLVHFWNVWYTNDAGKKSRFAQYSVSQDDGVTWGEPVSLPKNPEAESVIRHPVIELADDAWVVVLMDQTVVYNPQTGAVSPFGDGRNHGLTPVVRTPRGTFVSAVGERSVDQGKTWEKVSPFPQVGANGWRFDMMCTAEGLLVTAEVIGPGVGGDKWRFVTSADDGKSWNFDAAVEFYNPGRPIGGRACPKTVQIDPRTLGTVYYDVDASQPGGPGVFFLRTAITESGLRPGNL